MFKKSLCLVAIALFAVVSVSIADEDEKKSSPADTITIAELKDHMYFLASDALEGRVVGTAGYQIAADYAASQFRAAGIKPLLKDAEGKPTYFQEIPLIQAKVNQVTPWTLIKDGKSTEFPGKNVIGLVTKSADLPADTEIVFAGYGISEKAHGWDDFNDLDVKGKIAVMVLGAPMKDGKPVLPENVHNKYTGLNGAQVKVMTFLGMKRPAALIVLVDDELLTKWDMISGISAATSVRMKDSKNNRGGMNIPCPVAISKDEFVKAILEGEEYSPFANPENPLEGYKTFTLKNTSLTAKWEAEEKEISTVNVIGIVEGTDETLKEEYVTVGGHLDHIPGPEICNGADDNASGSIAVMEIGEAVAMQPFKRSTVLCLWAAEEVGLFGSNFFVNHPPIPLDKIKVNINLDMIARTDDICKEDRAIHALGTSKLCPEFKDMVVRLNDEKVNWPLKFDDKEMGPGGSDHQNFVRHKINAIFFFSGRHEDYHTSRDDAEKIEFDKMQKVTQLAYYIAAEIGNTLEYVCTK